MSPEPPQDTAAPTPPTEFTPDELLKELGDTLDKVTKERVDSEVTPEKTWQYLRLRKADLYYRGLQFLAPTVAGGIADYTAVGTPTFPGADSNEQHGVLDYNIDIIKSYGRKYVGVLGLRPFHNVKAVADDPENQNDRNAAKQADALASWLKDKWNLRIKNIEMFYWQWKAGTVYVYTPFAADKALFGEVEEPKFGEKSIEAAPAAWNCPNCKVKSPQPERVPGLNEEGQAVETEVCPNCKQPLSPGNYEEAQLLPIPDYQGTVKYPGSGPLFIMATGYQVTTAFDCPNDITKAPYLVYEREANQGELLQIYGQGLRKKLTEAPMNDTLGTQQGIQARGAAASLTASPRQGAGNRWTYGLYWLSTSMYEYVDDDAKRALLYKNFPDGLKLHKVNNLNVKLENENLADVWTAITPEPADTLYHDPACWGILGHQDMKNDLANIGMALLERGLPAFLVDPDVINAEALSSKPYSPMEIYEAKPGMGAQLDTAVKMLPPAAFPQEMMSFDAAIDANAQQYTGLLPPVWGGGEKQPTAEGQRTVLNQSLMQLGVPGEYAQFGYAAINYKACKQVEKYAPKTFQVTTGGATEVVDPEVLRSGKYHFEAEPGIPMSWAEKRDQLNSIIGQNPDLAHAMFLDAPINSSAMKDYLLSGMPEIHSPDEDLRAYVLTQIQLLITQQSMPDPQGGPPQPSVPPDDFVDPSLYATVAKVAQEWLIGPAGMKVKDTALEGYKNVLAWAMANNQKGMPPPPPPPPPEMPKVSVSLKGPDLPALGIVPAIQQDFGGSQGPPPGPPDNGGVPPPSPPSGRGESGPPNAQGGPPPPGGDPMIPQSTGPAPMGGNPAGPTQPQPQQIQIH